jgi:hypothetical protein
LSITANCSSSGVIKINKELYGMKEITQKFINQLYKKNKIAYKKWNESCNPYGGQSLFHDFYFYISIKKIQDNPVVKNIEYYPKSDNTWSRLYLVNDKFVVAPLSNKWRVVGRGKWYHFKDEKQLIEKYIKHD